MKGIHFVNNQGYHNRHYVLNDNTASILFKFKREDHIIDALFMYLFYK